MKNKKAIFADSKITKSKWQELIRIGNWSNSYKQFFINKAILQDFVKNFKANIVKLADKELPINYGHDRGGKAAGWLEDIKIGKGRRGKTTLLGKVRWTKKAEEEIRDEQYKYFSSEIDFLYKDQETGKETKNVLIGAALTNIPFVRGMNSASLSDIGQPTDIEIFTFNSTNMNMFEKLLSSLEEKDSIHSSELELIKTAWTELSEEEKSEFKQRYKGLSSKVASDDEASDDEDDNSDAEDAGDAENKDNDADADSNKGEENLAEMSEELKIAQTQLSEAHSKIDKLEAKNRSNEERARVQKLAESGKILGKEVEKWTKELCSLSQKKADKIFALLSAQPKVVDFEESGDSTSGASDSKDKALLAEAKKKAKESGRSVHEELADLYRESDDADE